MQGSRSNFNKAFVYGVKGGVGSEEDLGLQTVTSYTLWLGTPMLPGMYKNALISSTYG